MMVRKHREESRKPGAPPEGGGARLLTHEEVKERANRFYDLLERERQLQDFLVRLKIRGDYETVRELTRQHDEAIEEIQRIRMDGIVPIVKELNDYLKACKAADEAAEAKESLPGKP